MADDGVMEEVESGEAGRRSRLAALRASFTNLPNLLTMARVAAIPAIVALLDNYSPVKSYIACLIYIAAALTDLLDGWLARRRKQVSLLGKFLDPLADKLIVTAVLVYCAALDRCPPWLVVALLGRELAVTGLRALASAEGLVISASAEGKQKTALQMIGTIFLIIHFRYKILFLPWTLDFHEVGLWTLYLALGMSLVSAAGYLRRFLRAVYQTRS